MLGTRFHVHDISNDIIAIVKLPERGTFSRETLEHWADTDNPDIILWPGTDYLGQRTVEVLREIPAQNGDSDRQPVAILVLPFVPQWGYQALGFLLRSIAASAKRIIRVE
jgi:hypothetical protein